MCFKKNGPDGDKKMLIMWSKDKFWKDCAERLEHKELKEEIWPEATNVVLSKKTDEVWTQTHKSMTFFLGGERVMDSEKTLGDGLSKS